MVACDGKVSGTWQTAAVNRVASRAKASSDGVSPRVEPVRPEPIGPERVDRDQDDRRPRRATAGRRVATARTRRAGQNQARKERDRAHARLVDNSGLSGRRSVRLQPDRESPDRDQEPYGSTHFIIRDRARAVLRNDRARAVRYGIHPRRYAGRPTFAGGQPLAVSTDGRWVAYVVADGSDEWNIQEPRPTGYVVVQSLGSERAGTPRALTSGATHSSFPVWSPDGHRLAFVREESLGGRVVIWDADRDVATPVGDAFTARAYLAPQWHPSGARSSSPCRSPIGSRSRIAFASSRALTRGFPAINSSLTSGGRC